jgi:lipopolysaccharide assembly protein A
VHVKLVLSLILAGLSVLFVVQNVAVVEVRFLFWSLHMTLSLLIFLLFAAGLIVGWMMHSYWAYRRKSAAVQTATNAVGPKLGAGA